MAAAIARDEARATLSVSADDSSDDALHAAAVGEHRGGSGASRSMVIRRMEVTSSGSISNPLELRLLTLWAPGTCPSQPEQRIAGLGASKA